MDELRTPLRSLLDEPVEHDALERVRQRVHASRRVQASEAPSLWRFAPAAAALLVVSLGAVVWLATDRAQPPVAIAAGPITIDGAALRALETGEHTLDDGSVLEVASGGVRTIFNDGERVVLAQRDGRVTYDVQHGGPRTWSIDAGALTVEVIGTRFTIDRSANDVRVDVARGHVRVRGPLVEGGVRDLRAGESIHVGEPPVVIAPPVVDEPAAAVPLAPGAPAWRELAERGEYDDAFEAIGAEGLARRGRTTRSVDELFVLADTARLSGHADLAVEPLRRIVDEHRADARAGVAALTLGRLQLDALDDAASACRSLEEAIELGVPAHLREVALARAIDAHRRAGHGDRAAALAQQYLDEYPQGRDAERARAVLP
jgi:transmembrane sensor